MEVITKNPRRWRNLSRFWPLSRFCRFNGGEGPSSVNVVPKKYIHGRRLDDIYLCVKTERK